MKKIPTLFVRKFEGHRIVDITDEITPGCEEAFLNGVATLKLDGSCCAVINGKLYKRYDAKKNKKPPEGAIPCCDPDPITGHWPHWVPVDSFDPADKWFREAYEWTVRYLGKMLDDGTYEAIGPHFQCNPYRLERDRLERHGRIEIGGLVRDFEHVKKYLTERNDEGLVFWLNDEPVCKIKRSDFGLSWNGRKGETK